MLVILWPLTTRVNIAPILWVTALTVPILMETFNVLVVGMDMGWMLNNNANNALLIVILVVC